MLPAAFAKKIKDALAQSELLFNKGSSVAFGYIEELQKEVRTALVMSKGFSLTHLEGIQRELDAAAGRLRGRLADSLAASQDKAWKLGGSGVADGLKITLGVKLPALPDALLIAAKDFTAELITDLSKELIDAVSADIRAGVVLGENPYETMQRVEDHLFQDGEGAFFRAETIVRTENNRVFELANQSRLEQASDLLPGLKKIWLDAGLPNERDSHSQAAIDYAPGGDPGPIPVDEPFIVGGFPLMFPGDPEGDAGEVINCRCTSQPWMDSWSDAEDAVATEKTQEARITEYGTASSGNRGHAGRPGERGGSAAADAGVLREVPQVKAFSELIRNSRVEVMASYDKTGKAIFAKQGKEDSIDFTAKEMRAMRGAELAVHNHPGCNAPFSGDDVNFAKVENIKELVVVSKDFTFHVTPADGRTWPDREKVDGLVGLRGMRASKDRARYGSLIIAAQLRSDAEASGVYDHIQRQLWVKAAPQLGLIYTQEHV